MTIGFNLNMIHLSKKALELNSSKRLLSEDPAMTIEMSPGSNSKTEKLSMSYRFKEVKLSEIVV